MSVNSRIILSQTQEEILEAIGKKINSATDISEKLKKSLPFIVNQLALLEAKQIISKKKQEKKQKSGRPKQTYIIKKPVTQVKTFHSHNCAIQEIQNDLVEFYLQLIIQIPTGYQSLFSKYFWNKADQFCKVEAIGKLSYTDKEVELVAITDTKYLEELRKEISDVIIKYDSKTTRFACWVHSKEEIEEGIQKDDEYYKTLLKRIDILVDSKNELEELKEKIKKRI
jgi:septum formation topological specificity factor MinE